MSKLETNHRVLAGVLALVIGAMLLLTGCSASNPAVTSASASTLKGKITVSGAFALYPIVVRWAEEFQKIHPGVQFDISAGGAGKGVADTLGGMADIGMVSRQVFPEEVAKGAVYVAAVIDAVVPVASAGNPARDDLLAKGITKQTFADIWIGGRVSNWKDIFPAAGAVGKTDLHVFTRSDAAGAADTWALFLGDKKQEDLLGTGVYGDPGLAETVRKDPLGIGYNNIGFAYDARTRKQVDGLVIIPIDIDGNGKIDPEEAVYGSLDDLNHAIAKKVYPWPPARDLNLVALKQFAGVTREFVRWALTDGQKYASEAGYVALPEDRIQQELDKLQ